MAGVYSTPFLDYKENAVVATRNTTFSLLGQFCYTDSTFSNFSSNASDSRFHAFSTQYPASISRVNSGNPRVSIRIKPRVDLAVARLKAVYDDMRYLAFVSRGILVPLQAGQEWEMTDTQPVVSISPGQETTILSSGFALVLADVNKYSGGSLANIVAADISVSFEFEGVTDEFKPTSIRGDIILNSIPTVSNFAKQIPRQITMEKKTLSGEFQVIPLVQDSFANNPGKLGVVGFVLVTKAFLETPNAILRDYTDIGIEDSYIYFDVPYVCGYKQTVSLQLFHRRTPTQIRAIVSNQWAEQDNGAMGWLRASQQGFEVLVLTWDYIINAGSMSTCYVCGTSTNLLANGGPLEGASKFRIGQVATSEDLSPKDKVGKHYPRISGSSASEVRRNPGYNVVEDSVIKPEITETTYLPGIVELSSLPTMSELIRTV